MNIQQLADIVRSQEGADALAPQLSDDEWRTLASFMSQRFLQVGDRLIEEGDTTRELFVLAEGELQVSAQGHELAILRPGMVVGEGTFFSGEPRSASVSATQPGVAWALSWERYEKLSRRQPRIALEVTRALAAVLAVRMRAALLVGSFM